MARVTTLRDRLKEIMRHYKKIDPHKFLYNRKPELAKKYKRIRVWFLINDKERGYSVMRMEFKRKEHMRVSEWVKAFRARYKGRESLYNIITQAVLPAINNKGGNAWSFVSLLAWTGLPDIDAIQQTKNTAASGRRNKTFKKRNANAGSRNRSRQRNRKG